MTTCAKASQTRGDSHIRILRNSILVLLGTLTALIQAYESVYHPVPDATTAEVLSELADANELTGTVIAQRSGIIPYTVSALLSGKRRPTPEQMTALAEVFHVSPAVFLPSVSARSRRHQLS